MIDKPTTDGWMDGVHGKKDGELGGNEVKGKDNFVNDSEGQIQRLSRVMKDDIKQKKIKFSLLIGILFYSGT